MLDDRGKRRVRRLLGVDAAQAQAGDNTRGAHRDDVDVPGQQVIDRRTEPRQVERRVHVEVGDV